MVMNLNLVQLGANIASRRLECHMTQEELAEAVDITRTYLSLIECGHRNIRISLLVDIATALGTTVNVLLFGEQEYDHEDYIAEVEDLLYDCNIAERMVILDTARAVKNSIMKRRGTL